ncbi:MAG: NAD(P)H-dependent oxidoreductase subunit E [Firmicutes bacterium]|nr:NAD(P)H-dependent oxidoreductase subunit E [Bacillota bacterium]
MESLKSLESEDKRWQAIDQLIQQHKDDDNPQGALIAILHRAQSLFGYLPRELLDKVALSLGIPRAEVYGVVTFYSYFTLQKRGKCRISVCLGTACYIRGSGKVLEALKERLGIDVKETTKDGLFTLEATRCVGACGLAPVVVVGGEVHGRVRPEDVPELLERIRFPGMPA